MSVLVVGVSHRSAPVALLEELALDRDSVTKLVLDVAASPHVVESTVIATCNRLEIVAVVDRFHGSVEDLSRMLTRGSERSPESFVPHMYVHYDDGAVSHIFSVAAGLDSMVVGEAQILGQTRGALRQGQELGTVGPGLNLLFQQALRVGKRVHAETDIDRAAPSLVQAALDQAVVTLGSLQHRRALVIGAGSMAALSVATLSRMGVGSITIANRTADRAEHLAHEYDATVVPWEDVDAALAQADVVISCTGATGTVIESDQVRLARGAKLSPLVIIDLALPHDVDPWVAALDGVQLINLTELAELLRDSSYATDVEGVRTIVAEEVGAFLAARRQASVTPTVVALRSMATSVVEAEIERLQSRLPDLDEASRAEVLSAMRRIADKLLHQPTVRVRELANEQGAVSYADALAELFALDPVAVEAVTRPGDLS